MRNKILFALFLGILIIGIATAGIIGTISNSNFVYKPSDVNKINSVILNNSLISNLTCNNEVCQFNLTINKKVIKLEIPNNDEFTDVDIMTLRDIKLKEELDNYLDKINSTAKPYINIGGSGKVVLK